METVEDAVAEARAKVSAAASAVKPHLRGWLHAGTVPLALAAGIVLVVLAPPQARVACALYATSVVALFATSAAYHRGRWGSRAHAVMRRLDHSMIFVLIAGTYTPFAVLALEGATRVTVLAVVWGGAALGVVLRLGFRSMPRALFVLLYVGLGWTGVAVLDSLLSGVGVAAFVLVLVGGGLYSVGALVYATRRPDPSPRWFGFHEVFHAFTIAAAVVHFVAVSLTVSQLA